MSKMQRFLFGIQKWLEEEDPDMREHILNGTPLPDGHPAKPTTP